jgi:selenide, water dikinase
VFPGLLAKTRKLIAPKTRFAAAVPETMRNIMADPQTSGGLLIAMHPEDREEAVRSMTEQGIQAAWIGEVRDQENQARIIVE